MRGGAILLKQAGVGKEEPVEVRQELQVAEVSRAYRDLLVTVRIESPRIILLRQEMVDIHNLLIRREAEEEEMEEEVLRIKIEQLPEWNGDHKTAVDYFWDVGQLAALEGWMPEALGYWLPSRLVKGSAVHTWFSTLPTERQKDMRAHYLNYLRWIKDKFLGKKWQVVANLEFEQQAFRQEGHEKESPQQFFGRRTRHVRMLANADDGGPMEVFLVMRRAPLVWSTILVLENIKMSEDLYEKINDHDTALVDAFKRDSSGSEALTTHNLAATLRRMGFTQASSSANRRANLAVVEESKVSETKEIAGSSILEEPEPSESQDGAETVKQVYQTLKKRQRPPPKGGYKFAKNDHVTTKMGKLPPSPCKVCGSSNHWDRECPDWDAYLEKSESKSAKADLAEIASEDDQEIKSGNGNIVQDTLEIKTPSDSLTVSSPKLRQVHKVQVEVIEDEYWETEARMPKARKFVLELADDEEEAEVLEQKEEMKSGAVEAEEVDRAETVLDSPLEPPPSELTPIILKAKRSPRPGDSAIGVSVLAVKGWIGEAKGEPMDLRLDSCADITLISEECYHSLPQRPPIRTGHRMSLAQLTDNDTQIKGYVKLKVFMLSVDGELIETEAEAKVVRVSGDFSEDKEWMVECTMLANSDDSFFGVANTLITARNPMVSVSNLSDRPRFVRKGEILGGLVDPTKFFDTPKSEDEFMALKKQTQLISTVLGANLAGVPENSREGEDLSPGQREPPNARIRTDFGNGVPPMENNAFHGVHIRDELGRVPDAVGRLEESERKSSSRAFGRSAMMNASETTPISAAVDDESEDYGPKTAAMPDATVYPSEKMRELLDIGTLPDHLKAKAWEMLERRGEGFRF
ncbi:hypothetical protein FB451DRAFT_1413084 [Mycena latifolia]|nr:hypothetical protein FB451DRAFT_1413084 [Mycena latifolia]